jgi:peptidoglycan/LPS O-acetylase OafA/YrhL
MREEHLPFIDWMKAFGIAIIVYGHAAGSTVNAYTSPIEAKQLGVAAFLFVLGYALARERRTAADVVVRRLFTLYLIGIASAILLSAIYLLSSRGAALGNFLPFVFGANVLMLQDGFPANPTTWYIATYVHIVLLWAVLHNTFTLARWMLPVVIVAEVTLRVLFVDVVGPFFAYMALSNWLTVLLWGALQGQRAEADAPAPSWVGGVLVVAGLVALSITLSGTMLATPGFPFDTIVPGAPPAKALLASMLVTAAYVGCADALFRLTRVLRTPALVRFFARNTLVIFIGHMPMLYLLDPYLTDQNAWVARGIELLVCLPGLGLLSEVVMRVLQPERLRARLLTLLDLTPRPPRRVAVTNEASVGRSMD